MRTETVGFHKALIDGSWAELQREWILKLWGNILKKKGKDEEREGGVKEKEERKAGRDRKNWREMARAFLFLCIVACDDRPALQSRKNLSSNYTFSVSCPVNSEEMSFTFSLWCLFLIFRLVKAVLLYFC